MDTMPQKSGEEKQIPKLTNRQSKFIDLYISNNHCGSDAVLGAGYKQKKNPSNTACFLLKNPLIRAEIDRRTQELVKATQMDKPTFTLLIHKELKNAKQETTRARLLQLLGDTLGHTKQSEPAQNVNIFQNLANAKEFISSIPEHRNAFKDTISSDATLVSPDTRSGQEGGKQSAPETANDTTQMCATPMGDVSSTLSGEVTTLNPDSGVVGQG
jgi:phage terminase small subunit